MYGLSLYVEEGKGEVVYVWYQSKTENSASPGTTNEKITRGSVIWEKVLLTAEKLEKYPQEMAIYETHKLLYFPEGYLWRHYRHHTAYLFILIIYISAIIINAVIISFASYRICLFKNFVLSRWYSIFFENSLYFNVYISYFDVIKPHRYGLMKVCDNCGKLKILLLVGHNLVEEMEDKT